MKRRRRAPDRISQLPEPILQHILSFLPVKNAAQMATISNTWYAAWNSLPSLKFGDYFFRSRKDVPKLVNAVNQVLATREEHNISVKHFWLRLPYWRCWDCCVDNWINTLVACNIKELYFKMSTPIYKGIRDFNILPKSIFDAKTLAVLLLKGFKIELPPDGIKFSSLQELHLHIVLLDEKFVQALCTSCCNLRVLSFHWFDGLSRLQFGETLPKLKKVGLDFWLCNSELNKVDIRATNLEHLDMCNLKRELKVFDITACKALKSLFLYDVAVTEKWLECLSCLPNLEGFSLFACKRLMTMKMSSVSLKRLMISDCNLIVVELDTPNLIFFDYWCCALPTLKLKASVLLEAKISFDSGTPSDTDWYSKLLVFLGNFSHSKAVELSSKNAEAIIIPKDVRGNLRPPLYCANHLHAEFQDDLKYSVVDIVDSLLWIFPQLDTLSFYQHVLKTLKFIYEDALDEGEKPFCTSLPWECGRHKLKQAKMQNFTCMEQQELRNYFFTNPDINNFPTIL